MVVASVLICFYFRHILFWAHRNEHFHFGVFISSCTGTCWFLLLKISSTLRFQGKKILGSSFKLTPVTRTLPQFFFFFLNLQRLDVHLSDTQVQLIRGSLSSPWRYLHWNLYHQAVGITLRIVIFERNGAVCNYLLSEVIFPCVLETLSEEI